MSWSSVASSSGATCCSSIAVIASVPSPIAAHRAAFSGRIPAACSSPSASGGTGLANEAAARQRHDVLGVPGWWLAMA